MEIKDGIGKESKFGKTRLGVRYSAGTSPMSTHSLLKGISGDRILKMKETGSERLFNWSKFTQLAMIRASV